MKDGKKDLAVLEAEEEIYRYEEFNNGASPMWAFGNSCIVRSGDSVFASGCEKIDGAIPANNIRWFLLRREAEGWSAPYRDTDRRTREPCPLGIFPNGAIFLSANPTLTPPDVVRGPARPLIYQFNTSAPHAPKKILEPKWREPFPFTEHSYRSFAVDRVKREFVLFQNIGYKGAAWTYYSEGEWKGRGYLEFPWGGEYEKPQPIRVCYPAVQLKNRGVYFLGVSDIVEPVSEWKRVKKQLTGRDWDFDFRRLFYTWTPDVVNEPFRPWMEIASREETAGWIFHMDLLAEDNGFVHLLWKERALDERLRPHFFPDKVQSHALNYGLIKAGELQFKTALEEVREGENRPFPGCCRFHLAPDNQLWVVYSREGNGEAEPPPPELRVLRIGPDRKAREEVAIPLEVALPIFTTAGVRAGNAPSRHIDILGDAGGTMRYLRLRLD